MGINRDFAGLALIGSHLRQKIGGELVTVGQFESATVHLELISDVEVVDSVELVVVWRWQRDAMAANQSS